MNSDKNTKNIITNLDNLSLEIYNDREFVNSYASRIEYNSHNALYERPAMLSLLPDVKEKKILDAGCGPGIYSEILIDRGAAVTSVDYSDAMIEFAGERLGSKGNLFKANLNYPLEFLHENEFDLVLCSMVIHYLKDWRNIFSEFNRVLKKNGLLIFSTHHPFTDILNHPGSNYFETELLTESWPSYNIEMTVYRRPLSDIFKILKESDFKIDEVLEPVPVEECREKFPDAYKTLSTTPWFICFRTIKEK